MVPVACEPTVVCFDPQRTEVGRDVAFAGGGIDLESRIRRQHQRDVALLAGHHHLADRQLVRRVDLDVAIASPLASRRSRLPGESPWSASPALGPATSVPRSESPEISRSPGTDASVMSERADLNVTVLAILLRRMSLKKSPFKRTAPVHVFQGHIIDAAVDVHVARHLGRPDRALFQADLHAARDFVQRDVALLHVSFTSALRSVMFRSPRRLATSSAALRGT